jgi:hypothetical protein
MTNTNKKLLVTIGLAAAALLAAPAGEVAAQQAPTQLTVAIYAPSAQFADSAARSAYIQGLAKAIQTKTGVTTVGKAYVRLGDLRASKPDFAIIEGLCLAAASPGPVLATGTIGGATSQSWALFSRGDNFNALRGKKLAYMETGCRDSDFLENGMLDSEAKVKSHFGQLVGKPDTIAAVATVREYKQADAVFAPASAGKGLQKVFDSGQVPNPGFVQMNKGLPPAMVKGVQEAVLAYGASNQAIEGWRAAASYAGLAGQLGARTKRPIFAVPEVVRMDDQDVIVIPQSQYQQATIRQHFWQPADKRL